MRKTLLFLFLTLGTLLHAQQIGTWKVYPSYWNATQNVVVANLVYSLNNGNLLVYNTEDTSVRTYDCLNDLNDIHIQHMAYCQETKRLLLIYDNSNIDLMDLDDNVVNINSLKEKILPDKTINDIYVDGHMAYLCMKFGIIEVDMKECVIRETYQMGKNVIGAGIIDGAMAIVCNDGIFACDMQKNMHESANWNKVNGVTGIDKVVSFQNNLIGLRTWTKAIFIIKTNGQYPTLDDKAKYSYLKVCDGNLVYGNNEVLCVRSTLDNGTTYKVENQWNDVNINGNSCWASDGENGLIGYKLAEGTVSKQVGPIHPNSPKNDLSYRMHWVGDRLLVAGGINTIDPTYNPPTSMYLQDGEWTIFEEPSATGEYKGYRLANTTDLVQDPTDESHHYASLHRIGLCEYRNGKFVKLYNQDNSPIRSILPQESYYYNYTSCSGLQFDTNGNLWMLNSETDTIVRVLQNNGKWTSLFYDELKGVSLCDEYLMHSSGLMFLNSRRMDNRGFFCFDYNGTLNSTRDDRHILRTTIVNQDGTSYTPDEFYCMTEDLDGRIWCGTNLGVFVIDNAERFFDQDFRFQQIKIARNDGSGLADYLLSGVSISCITIDGANRKWVGTHSNGLYLISADGTEMIHHFSTDNSPILSKNIYSVAVNPTSGIVMIGTDRGLCSYVSDATEAEEELEKDNVLVFPNPVRSNYNGPIAVRGLSMDSEVKILSSSGQLVWSGISSGGTFTWNGCNKQGRRVASGIYHVVASNAQGKNTVVTRIVVVH